LIKSKVTNQISMIGRMPLMILLKKS